MPARAESMIAVIVGMVMLLSGCSVPAPAPAASPTPTPTPTATTATALERWEDAYAFLDETDTQVEVYCGVPVPEGSTDSVEPYTFHALSDRAEWEPFLLLPRNQRSWDDVVASGRFCGVVVPTTVPYADAAIEDFLNPHGLYFADSNAASGLTFTEIAYAGSNPSDPDYVYFDEPGLWALRLAFGAIGAEALDRSEIIQPATETDAERWLAYAQPVLDWYGYEE